MSKFVRTRFLLACALAATLITSDSHADRPLSSDSILQLHTLGIDTQAIVKKISDDGIAFAANEAALAKLEGQGRPGRSDQRREELCTKNEYCSGRQSRHHLR